MAKQLEALDQRLTDFVRSQHMFFAGTAAADGRVNVSPKGMDTLRVLSERRVVWLNLTGSGNETAAHVLANARMTLMFCAFEGAPLILRIYGTARILHAGDAGWGPLIEQFPDFLGARQLFDLDIEMVQTSCGFGVPLLEHQGSRDQLDKWAARKGRDGIEAYWRTTNQRSIDGLPTDMAELEDA